MDVFAAWPGSTKRFLIDVTIRSPHASYVRRAHCVPGAAARRGETDKLSHYGNSVSPFSVEPGGRIGSMGLRLLASLHRESAEFGKLRPGTGRPQSLYLRAMRAEVETAIVSSAAQLNLLALGTLAVQALGWPAYDRRRRAPR